MGYKQKEGTRAGANTGRGLTGRFSWLSNRLNRNERINSRGIESFFKYDALDNEAAYTQRSWLELVKITQLNGGYIFTELA